MRVHITLEKEVRKDESAKQNAMAQIGAVAPLKNVNDGRFQRYGIISADVPPATVEEIRKVGGVRSVEQDETRHALD